ncbi:glycosyltransferase family 2 protein [Bradyrhizobium sp. SYSU BS000235]|uniref:glycosyltransferase family 2 protein n=1 Tax=Bradyrhizobium sp. SYSU BS000235 TaxID=3411332 RepID=UPI003C75FCE6
MDGSIKEAESTQTAQRVAAVAVVIVGFKNADDIAGCLTALSASLPSPGFDIFICENGGRPAFEQLLDELLQADGPCAPATDFECSDQFQSATFVDVHRLRLRERPGCDVWIGCASGNLGYAGGINAWLGPLAERDGWKGVWILNPDTEPERGALAALVEHAEATGKAMVGSTILDGDGSRSVRFRGGVHWQKLRARSVAIGLGDRADALHDVQLIEREMDSPSGASMYVTRACIEAIGPMDERYFLFFEDLDWGVRAKQFGLGYASASIVAHKRGTTTGSAKAPGEIPKLTVYLEHRNGIHFVRRHFPWALPLRVAASCLYSLRFLLRNAPGNSLAAIHGMAAGLMGEVGQPSWHRNQAK